MKKFFFVLNVFLVLQISSNCQNWLSFGNFEGWMASAYTCLHGDSVSNILYIGGSNVFVNGTQYSGIVAYDGVNFNSLGNSTTCLHGGPNGDLSATVYCVANYKNNIYAGGDFKYADTTIVNNIARWDGTKWHPVGQGIEGAVRCLSVIDDTLYVGGNLYSIISTNTECNGIAKWDGTEWHSISNIDTTDGITVDAIVGYKNQIYIGGNFGNFTDTLNEVARWDGTQWSSLGGGILGDSWVDAMMVYKGDLYVGGYFYEHHGNAGDFIMRWDGESWSDVAGGLQGLTPTGNAQVHSLCIYNDELWVGGVQSYAGGIPSKYISKWDGEKWCGIETNIDDRVMRFTVYNNMMYVAGGFDTIGNIHSPYIAKWIGGNYVDTCGTATEINEYILPSESTTIFPNPANDVLNIETGIDNAVPSVEVFDITGKLIMTCRYNDAKPKLQLDISTLPGGIFNIKIHNADGSYSNSRVVKI